jgi:hypothetical protein
MDRFFGFLKNPDHKAGFIKPSLMDLFTLLVTYFILAVPLMTLAYLLSGTFEITHKELDANFAERLIRGILLAPLIEETLFRLIYVFNKRNLGLILLTSIALTVFFLFRDNIAKQIIFAASALTACILLLVFSRSREFFNNHFRFFFYSIAFAFAILHIFNFNGITGPITLLSLFFVLPQLVLGIILGYVRLTYGFIYAVLFHAVVNLPVLI